MDDENPNDDRQMLTNVLCVSPIASQSPFAQAAEKKFPKVI